MNLVTYREQKRYDTPGLGALAEPSCGFDPGAGVPGGQLLRARCRCVLDSTRNSIPAVAIASREPSREAVLQNFKTKLGLTTEQTNEIAMVLEDYRHYYESLQDQLDDLRATGRNRIVQVLDPAQRAKFEKLVMDLAPQLGSGGN